MRQRSDFSADMLVASTDHFEFAHSNDEEVIGERAENGPGWTTAGLQVDGLDNIAETFRILADGDELSPAALNWLGRWFGATLDTTGYYSRFHMPNQEGRSRNDLRTEGGSKTEVMNGHAWLASYDKFGDASMHPNEEMGVISELLFDASGRSAIVEGMLEGPLPSRSPTLDVELGVTLKEIGARVANLPILNSMRTEAPATRKDMAYKQDRKVVKFAQSARDVRGNNVSAAGAATSKGGLSLLVDEQAPVEVAEAFEEAQEVIQSAA